MQRLPLRGSLVARAAAGGVASSRTHAGPSSLATGTRRCTSARCAPPAIPPTLCAQRRCKGYHFFINLDDPEATRLRVEEDLEKLASEEKTNTTAYLHSLLNLTLSHYQRKDFVAAHQMAMLTHQKALAHNSKSSLIYFSALTSAQCADALAGAYEAHMEEMETRAATSAALTPAPSVVFGAKRAIAKLRADAERYRGIAQRIFNRPDMAYMRGDGQGGTGGRRGWNSSRQATGTDTRCAWQEDSSNSGVDEEYASHAYGPRWQTQRKRPEHAEVKHFYKRQYTPSSSSPSSSRWTVPK